MPGSASLVLMCILFFCYDIIFELEIQLFRCFFLLSIFYSCISRTAAARSLEFFIEQSTSLA
jgi:hypothetical protein